MKLKNTVFEDIEIGQSAALTRHVKMSDIAGFAALTGDCNPVHLNQDYAVQTPFHGIVAHGMWSAAQISAVIGTKLPGPGSVYLSQDLKFVAPVKVGDVITTKVTVVDKDYNHGFLTIDCQCTNQKNEEVVFGIATILAPTERLVIDIETPEVRLVDGLC
ncbi:hypothetical protein N473_02775 [Pseudoalteromonas luteoviolacea CPMOR-1]|uniref:MaoC-like domain-containing protein n=1 Tax=Pseudoalteromonas luteoviolacea CPMOR-1 TaxID=1365248 RepID=A0A167IRJ1_9GAMM|nr:MaoC/PaaZ C-terminal domain-containing protein [Pseudoalteromonas luteoviolacea]KZN59857.1 hypothetical protein N473_02775 [Pseudoalteromonas luteoviolacea CPMOR-1]